MSDNLFDTLRERFAHRLDATALDVPAGPTWTYRQLDDRSAAMAGALHELGVRTGVVYVGDTIAIGVFHYELRLYPRIA